MLTVREFYLALDKKIGFNAIYGYVEVRKIRHIKIGRKILIFAAEVQDFPQRLFSGENTSSAT